MGTKELASTVQKYTRNGYKIIVRTSGTNEVRVTDRISTVEIFVTHTFDGIKKILSKLTDCIFYSNEGSQEILVLQNYCY